MTIAPGAKPTVGCSADWDGAQRHYAPLHAMALLETGISPPQELERHRRDMEPIWRTIENHLAAHAWLAGNAFSMGDIPMGIMAHWWYSFPIDHGELPRMADWHQRLLQRPAFISPLASPYRPSI